MCINNFFFVRFALIHPKSYFFLVLSSFIYSCVGSFLIFYPYEMLYDLCMQRTRSLSINRRVLPSTCLTAQSYYNLKLHEYLALLLSVFLSLSPSIFLTLSVSRAQPPSTSLSSWSSLALSQLGLRSFSLSLSLVFALSFSLVSFLSCSFYIVAPFSLYVAASLAFAISRRSLLFLTPNRQSLLFYSYLIFSLHFRK